MIERKSRLMRMEEIRYTFTRPVLDAELDDPVSDLEWYRLDRTWPLIGRAGKDSVKLAVAWIKRERELEAAATRER